MSRNNLLPFVIPLLVCCTALAHDAEFEVPWIGYDTGVYPEGYLPTAMRTADFNSDGVADLAVCSYRSNSRLSILFGDGHGGFLTPVMYEIPLGAMDLEVADFDGDKDVDVVVANTGQRWEGTSFTLFKNDGRGVFVFGGIFECGRGPNGLTAADFDGDLDVDVAVAHDDYVVYGRTIAVVYNNGDGTFSAPQILTLTAGTNRIDAGDLNGDEHPDLVVGHETNRITILMNDGEGGFAVNAVIDGLETGSIVDDPAVKLADADGDVDVDILYSHLSMGGYDNGAIAFYRNPGGGGFGSPERIPLVPGLDGAVGIEMADLTGDGAADIIAALANPQHWVLVPGDGEGGFDAAREYGATENPVDVEAIDLDGDGALEAVILGRNSYEVAVYTNPGDGGFVQPPVIPMVDPALSPVSYSNLQSSDLDNDGDLDLVVGFSANFLEQYGVSVRRNNGDGTFAEPEIYDEVIFPHAIRLCDMNGDGFDDLLWIDDDFPARFRVRYNQNDGTFGSLIIGPAVGNESSFVDAYDFDNDGDLDVIVSGWFEVAVSENLDGIYRPYRYHEVSGMVNTVAAGDFNGDGNLDLLTDSGVQGYLEISDGNGDLTFGRPFLVVTGRDVKKVSVADLDGDGSLDFAANYNLDGHGLGVRRGRGNGDFFTPIEYHGSYCRSDNYSTVDLADVDGDGHLDAMIASFGAQDVAFWRGNGDGTFQELARYGDGRLAYDHEYGDFTGDGRGDLAVLVEPASPSNGWYYPGIILLRGTTGAMPGDVDGDGVVDFRDLLALLAAWGPCPEPPAECPADFDGNGFVDFADLLVVLANWT